ncbi:MAG TPA: flagellin [Chthonomonadales bacterium]|nr:flagellin [Chthonomonadales bacterium]
MSLRINTNTTALNALRNLQNTTAAVTTSIERLSSGLRINRAADDPAGLIISESLRAQIDGMNQAVANSQDAINLMRTAEGALNEINTLLRSIRTLAVHAANTGVNDAGAVRADQSQIDSAIASIDRIATRTQFGSKRLLDGTSGITSSVIDTQRVAGIFIGGTFDAAQTATSDVTITLTPGYSATRAEFVGGRTFAGVNSVMGTGSGTVVINGQTVKVDASDTVQSVINKINTLSGVTNVSANWSGSGTSGSVVLTQLRYGAGNSIKFSESDGIIAGTQAGVYATSMAGRSAAASVQMMTIDPRTRMPEVTTVAFTASDLEGADGLRLLDTDGNTIYLTEDGNTTLVTPTRVATVTAASLQFQVGGNANQYVAMSLGNVQTNLLGNTVIPGTTLRTINVTSGPGATAAIEVADEAIEQISALRARLGAFQKNTLESTVRYLNIGIENLASSESQIRDTDVAAEVVAMTKNQILQSAGHRVLSQANMAPQQVLALLQ